MGWYDRYLDYDVNPDPLCDDCIKHDKQLERIAYWLESVVDQLYSNEPLDASRLEDHLDECCHLLQMNIPKTPIRITKT